MNLNNVEFEYSIGIIKQIREASLPEIVFSGRSNVGKSSLINKLLNRKALARVSSMPGKTITINFYKTNDFRLVDLPGYGYARSSVSERDRWSQLVQNYFEHDRPVKLVVQLVDVRHPATKDDMNMINYLLTNNFPFVIVFTKADKLSKAQLQARLDEFNEQFNFMENLIMIPVSSKTGQGKDELIKVIGESLEY